MRRRQFRACAAYTPSAPFALKRPQQRVSVSRARERCVAAQWFVVPASVSLHGTRRSGAWAQAWYAHRTSGSIALTQRQERSGAGHSRTHRAHSAARLAIGVAACAHVASTKRVLPSRPPSHPRELNRGEGQRRADPTARTHHSQSCEACSTIFEASKGRASGSTSHGRRRI